MSRSWQSFLLVLAVSFVAPRAAAEDGPPAPAAQALQQKTAFEALDRAITRCDELLARDDSAPHQVATTAALSVVKKRRDALRVIFDQAKYDELRVDLNIEYQRLAAWMAPPITGAASANGPAPEVSIFQLDPSPADPAEIKIALAALAREIARQEDRNKTLPEGAVRDSARVRLEAVKRAQSELSKNFTRGGWDVVVIQLRR